MRGRYGRYRRDRWMITRECNVDDADLMMQCGEEGRGRYTVYSA